MRFSTKIPYLIIGLIFLNIVDFVLTYQAVHYLGAVEVNPILRPITYDPVQFLTAKIVLLTIFLSSGIWFFERIRPTKPVYHFSVAVLTFIVITYLIVVLNNTITYMELLK